MRAALLLCAIPLMAQEARVSGIVLDSSGARAPDARVSVINEDTGLRYASRTGVEGAYIVPAARPGRYKIAVRKEGFRTLIRTGLELAANENTRVDFVLQVGSVDETVLVTGQAAPVSAGAAPVSTVLGRDFIDNLPLSGRGLLTLLEAAPGVLITPVSAGQEAGQFSVNGQRASANYITVDGISVNSGVGLATGMQLAPAPASAPRSTVTQSFGGALPAYTAYGGMQNLASLETVEEFRLLTSGSAAQFGRMPGGNLVISTRSGGDAFHGSLFEYLRNDKFDANDWFNNRSGSPRPPLALNDFGGTAGGPLRRDRTFFFVSHETFRLRQTIVASPGFAIPSVAAAPQLLAGLSATSAAPKRSTLASTGLRLDHRFSPRVQSFARYQRSPSSDGVSYAGGGVRQDLRIGSDSATAGLDVTLGAALFQTLRVNYTRAGATVGASGEGASQSSLAAWLPPLFPTGQTSYTVWILDLNLVRTNWASQSVQRQWNIVDTLSGARGGHLWQVGFDYRRLAPRIETRPYFLEADYATSGMAAAGQIAMLVVQRFQPVSSHFANLSLFAQDEARLSSRVSLSYGLRWESNPPPTSEAAAPPFGAADLSNPGALRTAFNGRTLWTNGYRHLAPRVGAAFRITPSGATVFRASAGVHYDLGFAQALGARPPSSFTILTGLSVRAGPEILAPAQLAASLVTALARDFSTPATTEWAATLEQSVARAGGVQVSYVGAAGRRLLFSESVDWPGQLLTVATNRGSSDYHALQAQARLRARRFHALASFAWTHSTDNVSQDSRPVRESLASGRHANSDFDVRLSASAELVFRLPLAWTFSAIYRARTGFPIDVLTNRATRPDLVFGEPVWRSDGAAPGGRTLNPDAFRDSGAGADGSLGRNAIPGLGMSQADLSLARQFHLSETLTVQFRAEALNALNHPNFGNPEVAVGVSGSGAPRQMLNQYLGAGSPVAGLTPALQIGGPRALQFVVRLRF